MCLQLSFGSASSFRQLGMDSMFGIPGPPLTPFNFLKHKHLDHLVICWGQPKLLWLLGGFMLWFILTISWARYLSDHCRDPWFKAPGGRATGCGAATCWGPQYPHVSTVAEPGISVSQPWSLKVFCWDQIRSDPHCLIMLGDLTLPCHENFGVGEVYATGLYESYRLTSAWLNHAVFVIRSTCLWLVPH